MALEVKLDDRVAKVKLLSQDDNNISILVDDNRYDLDIIQVEKGVYSVLFKGRSYNVELIETQTSRKYSVNTFYHSYKAEIIDPISKYLRKDRISNIDSEQNTIFSPMPGKIVKILYSQGDSVKRGDTIVIVSAMKMESEYKAMKDGVIKKIFIKEGQTVDTNQPMIHID